MSGRRIFIAHSQSWPPSNGPAIHVWAIAERLARRGFLIRTQAEAGPPDIELVRPNRPSLVRAVRASDALYIRVDGHLAREKVTALARLAHPRPAVVWEVNASLEELLAHGMDQKMVARHRRIRRYLARGADAAVVVSPELVGYVKEELGVEDVTVVENGADWPPPPAEPSALRTAGAFRVLWMGSGRYPWQGMDTVLVAADKLAEHPDIVVAVLDADNQDPGPLPPNVIRLAPGTRSEVATHIAAADCVLCLYHATPWAPGGFTMSPIKLFDAWSFGRPVIATKLDSLERLVEDGQTGLLVSDDASDVAAAILRLRGDASLRERLGRAGQEAVAERYNWDRAADEISAVLERVIQRVRR